jgi:hypothetical protein
MITITAVCQWQDLFPAVFAGKAGVLPGAAHYGWSIEEAVFYQRPNGGKSVFQADFFTVFVIASVERDGNFKNTRPFLEDFSGEFGFEIEAPGVDDDVLYGGALEHLVARFHICEDRIVEDIRQQGEEIICDHVPEHGRTAWAAQKTRSEDDVGDAFLDGFQHGGDVARVIFQIGILDEYDVSINTAQPGHQGRSFALILVMIEYLEGWAGMMRLFNFFEDRACTIRRTVVDDDDFCG